MGGLQVTVNKTGSISVHACSVFHSMKFGGPPEEGGPDPQDPLDPPLHSPLTLDPTLGLHKQTGEHLRNVLIYQ